MNFWKRGSSASSSGIKWSGSTNSLTSSLNSSNNNNGIHQSTLSKRPSLCGTKYTSSNNMPTRKQRMQLLKCIIHHAYTVQKQYLVPKQLPSVSDSKVGNSSSIFDTFNQTLLQLKSMTSVTAYGFKCFKRD